MANPNRSYKYVAKKEHIINARKYRKETNETPWTKNRSKRLTNAEIKTLEEHQTKVIHYLVNNHGKTVAKRILRCQTERSARRGNPSSLWTWKCNSFGCWACRRTIMRAYWQAIRAWLITPETNPDEISFAIIPISEDMSPLRWIRKNKQYFHDIRQRRDLMIGVIASSNGAHVLIKHPGIARETLWETLERRFPNILVTDATSDENASLAPSFRFSVEDAANLGKQRRGLTPLRVVVAESPKLAKKKKEEAAKLSDPEWDDEAMPIV